MNKVTQMLIAAVLTSSVTLASADVVHVYNCKLNEGKTFTDLTAASSAWLAAVKTMEGGDQVEAYHNYPIAANTGDGGFLFVEIVPDFKVWGVLTDAYPDSAAQKADNAWGEVASCESTSLWASEQIE